LTKRGSDPHRGLQVADTDVPAIYVRAFASGRLGDTDRIGLGCSFEAERDATSWGLFVTNYELAVRSTTTWPRTTKPSGRAEAEQSNTFGA
jgi:hypothetical protein